MGNRVCAKEKVGFFRVLGVAALGWMSFFSLAAAEEVSDSAPEIKRSFAAKFILPIEALHEATVVRAVHMFPSKNHLPDHLEKRLHWDYPFLFQWVPRGWTTVDWGQPDMLIGNQVAEHRGSPKPIGERGSFQISTYPELPIPLCWLPLYFAFTTSNGYHMRLGARWDDIDYYVQIPSIAIKKLDDETVSASAGSLNQ